MRVNIRVKLLTCNSIMFTSLWIFVIVVIDAVAARGPSKLVVNASSYSFNPTRCEEFGQGARISPHDVVDSLWRIFYFWAEGMEISTILFALPSVKTVNAFKKFVEVAIPNVHVEWKNATLFMEPRLGIRVLFVSSGQNGYFSAIVKNDHLGEDRSLRKPQIHLTTVRMKTVDRFLGIVNCIDQTAFALARVSEMPQTKNECYKAAAGLGLDTRNGKSYLYIENPHIFDEL